MYRVLQCVVAAVVLLGISAVAQAAAIPMVYDNSSSTTLLAWDCEGTGVPSVGSVAYTNPTYTKIVAGGGSLPDAYQGSQMLESVRTSSSGSTWADVTLGSASGDGETTTTTLGFYGVNADSYCYFTPNTDGTNTTQLAEIGFLGNGTVVNEGVATGLTHNLGQWNDVTLTHVNGTDDWTIKVNGSSVSVSSTLGGALSNYGGLNVGNGYYGTFYVDAKVPEPSTLALLASGLVGLLAYAWRKRK